ncbi:MAG: 3-deoxy-D-manno-octulosonic-acid transferase [Bermanella sp.]|jgi:3-deoxy-D-manno-octulosonic-acid transferase
MLCANSRRGPTMPLLLYTGCFYLLLPLIVLRLCQRSLRAPAYRQRIAERFACFTAPEIAACRPVWVHAVSVGEVVAAVPMIRQLQEQNPSLPIVVTTMTPTGSERAQAMLGDSVFHVYAPYDVPLLIRRFIRRLKPRLLIIMETEIWPNTILICRREGVEVVLANARLSEKSARGYARLSSLTQQVFVAFSRIVVQTEADAARFRELGASGSQLVVGGSIKFDIQIKASLRQSAQAERVKLKAEKRPVWICASTHEGEEDIILSAFAAVLQQLPDALLVIAPRHPERFKLVAAKVSAAGFGLVRRSQGGVPEGQPVLLLDTMGELLLLFGCADVATVGGSLIDRGGHNSLEPAAWGLPIVNGPSDFNFAEISQLLQQSGALTIAGSEAELGRQVSELLADEALCKQKGAAGFGVIEQNRGALGRLLGVLSAYHR